MLSNKWNLIVSVFNTTVSIYLIYTCLKIYVILSKFIIKAEVSYLLKSYILAGVNDLMLHLVRLSPLIYLSILYFPFTAAGWGRSWNIPANPKTDKSLQLIFSGSRNMTNFGWNLTFFFHTFITCGKTWNTILNKYKEWHWFLYILFLFNFNKNNVFLISMFLCFALVPKLVPRTVDFLWYWYRILKFWYHDNTTRVWLVIMRNTVKMRKNKSNGTNKP